MKSSEIIPLISRHRFGTYKRLFKQIVPDPAMSNEHNMVIFYMEIQVLHSNFFMPIQALEVTLRNQIHNFQSIHHNTPNWVAKLIREGSCTDGTKDMFIRAKKKTKNDFKDKGIVNRNPSPEDYIGRLSFAFWVEMLQAHYRGDQFWQYNTIRVFPNRDKIKISEIYELLCQVNIIRNRLYHYEPLWNTSLKFSNVREFCKVLEDQYYLIVRIIRYLSLDKEELLEEQVLNFDVAIEEFVKKYEKK